MIRAAIVAAALALAGCALTPPAKSPDYSVCKTDGCGDPVKVIIDK